MAINDTMALAVKGVVGGQDHVHTLHFRVKTALPTEADLIAAWEANCGATYRSLFIANDSPVQLISAAHVCGTLPLRATAELAPASPVGTRIAGTGVAGSERAPSWLAQVVSVRTASAGRSRRGRFYVGGLLEYDINGNDLSINVNTSPPRWAAIADYIANLMTAFVTLPSPTDFTLVVHSHKLAAVPGTQCQDSSTPVTGMIRRLAIGSMKSRKPGSGN